MLPCAAFGVLNQPKLILLDYQCGFTFEGTNWTWRLLYRRPPAGVGTQQQQRKPANYHSLRTSISEPRLASQETPKLLGPGISKYPCDHNAWPFKIKRTTKTLNLNPAPLPKVGAESRPISAPYNPYVHKHVIQYEL